MAPLFDRLLSNRAVYERILPWLNEHVLVRHMLRFNRIRESRLAHRWLDGLKGVEVGPSESNPFGLATRNIGRRDKIYEREQLQQVGCYSHIHIEASADDIPLPDSSEDFVLSSHVIEHCPDTIKTLLEWFRVTRVGGILFMIVPQRDAAPSDVGRPLSTWEGLFDIYCNGISAEELAAQGVAGHCHYHVFTLGSMKSFVARIFGDALVLLEEQDPDDKVGNGFTLVYRKAHARAAIVAEPRPAGERRGISPFPDRACAGQRSG